MRHMIAWFRAVFSLPRELRELRADIRYLRLWRIRHLYEHKQAEYRRAQEIAKPQSRFFPRWCRRNRREG